MTITAHTIKVGDVVQITHGGLPDWVTIEVLTLPSSATIEGYEDGTYGIKVKYINSPEYLVDSGAIDMETGTGYQWNIYETRFRPAPAQPLTNEEILKVFLKEHEVLTIFKLNLQRPNKPRNYVGTEGSTKVNRALLDAFQWHSSVKGIGHWRNLNNKWEKLCIDFNLKGRVCMKKFLRL